MRQIAIIALFCLGMLFATVATPAWADGPSFDCARAALPVEKVICANGDLSALDREIAHEYQAALSAGQTTVANQRAWLAERNSNKVCGSPENVSCLRGVMTRQLAFLVTRPEALSPPGQGPASFDCAVAKSRTGKAICGNQVLLGLEVALMNANAAALRENFFVRADDWPAKRESECGKRPELDMENCIEKVTKARIEGLSFHIRFQEASGIRLASVNIDDQYGYPFSIVRDASERQAHAKEFEDADIFKLTGTKVVGCPEVVELTVQVSRNSYSSVYGGLCDVERGGKRSRELICQSRFDLSRMGYLDVADRPIETREIEIFTAVNCRHF